MLGATVVAIMNVMIMLLIAEAVVVVVEVAMKVISLMRISVM